MGLLLHPCGTRDTLPKRVPVLCTKAMWHPCTLKTKISRARARPTTLSLLYFQIILLIFCILRIIYSPHYQKGCNPFQQGCSLSIAYREAILLGLIAD